MMLKSEEVDKWLPGESAAASVHSTPPPRFVTGGVLAMRPSNMGIQSAASPSDAASPLGMEANVGGGDLHEMTAEERLSIGWSKHLSARRGLPYYVDAATGESAWQLPGSSARVAREHSQTAADSALPPSQLRRLNEQGDSAPGSQAAEVGNSQDSDLARRASDGLRISDVSDGPESRASTRGLGSSLGSAPTAPMTFGVRPSASHAASELSMRNAQVLLEASEAAAGRNATETSGMELRRTALESSVPLRGSRPAALPLQPESFSPFRDGMYWCCWCHNKSFASAPGFMRHLTTKHAQREIDAPMRATLVALQRCVCTDVACGGFRPVGARRCNRCGVDTRARPPAEGDRIAGPVRPGVELHGDGAIGSVDANADAQDALNSDTAGTRTTHADDPVADPIVLPQDWVNRLHRLSSNSLIHVPASKRVPMCLITRQCWNRLADGCAVFSRLEQGRSKLLLAPIPEGLEPAHEVGQRIDLWIRGRFCELLQRIEEQMIIINRIRRKKQNTRQIDRGRRGRKAKQIAAEGAYRKATQGLTSQMLDFRPEEDVEHATELLPASVRADCLFVPRGAFGIEQPASADASAVAWADPERDRGGPLKGVRYAALTAPGPTGTRPEHIKEMLGVRKRTLANSLLKALDRVHRAIAAKTLAPEMRWLTRTKLCWQRKKTGKPRPIKMGEFLRSSYAKRYSAKNLPSIRRQMRPAHQWGIGIPGACEAMAHWRGAVEECILSGDLEPAVAIDVDMVNMFGNQEWPDIRDAIQDSFHELVAWTEWHHEEPAITQLPSGLEFGNNRGAEQGDAFGTIQSCMTLAQARGDQWRSHAGQPLHVADEWYIDDGQAFVPPSEVESWLKALNLAVAKFGGSRGSIADGNAKSSCRLICPESRRHQFSGWDTSYVHDTCKVLHSDAATTALGAIFGDDTTMQAAVGEAIDKAAELREAIADIDHAATEVVLTRQCADVAKLSYHLRLNGDRIGDELLCRFDSDLRRALETSLGGELSDSAWMQATAGVQHSGLGLREAKNIALASFVASRYAARPHVCEMATHIQNAGFGDASVVMNAFDLRTRNAAVRMLSSLPPEIGVLITDALEAAWDHSERQWTSLFDDDPMLQGDGEGSGQRNGRLGGGITPSDGDGDPEHPLDTKRDRVMRIQRVLMRHIDEFLRGELRANLQDAGDEDGLIRLDELANEQVDHTWMWKLSRHRGPTLSNGEYVEAVRIRLGVAGPADPIPCARCGRVFDSSGAHASCCEIAEATRGHHAVSEVVHGVASQCDPGAEKEVAGLIAGTDLRPADILTSAVDGGLTSLDIGITSPHAQYNRGVDCTEGMYGRKVAYYAPYNRLLQQQNVQYQPLIWSCYGRPHERTTAILRTLSKRVSRRRGCSDASSVLHAMNGAIAVEIWRRAAKQCQSCWPEMRDLG